MDSYTKCDFNSDLWLVFTGIHYHQYLSKYLSESCCNDMQCFSKFHVFHVNHVYVPSSNLRKTIIITKVSVWHSSLDTRILLQSLWVQFSTQVPDLSYSMRQTPVGSVKAHVVRILLPPCRKLSLNSNSGLGQAKSQPFYSSGSEAMMHWMWGFVICILCLGTLVLPKMLSRKPKSFLISCTVSYIFRTLQFINIIFSCQQFLAEMVSTSM